MTAERAVAAAAAAAPQPRPVVLVTGLSGAGRTSILHVLEDLGFETVDNPPLAVLEALVGPLAGRGNNGARSGDLLPLAAGIDSRTRDFDAATALRLLERLRARPDIAVSLVFAAAEETVLLRRYTETRRRHPLADGEGANTGGGDGNGPVRGGRGVAEGIAREAALLAPLRAAADLVVDTSDLPLRELRRMIEGRFRPQEGGPGLAVAVVSFAYPRGLPREADLVFDLRFLRNPHYDPALRPLTGRDGAVAAHVETDPDFAPFWQRMTGFLEPLLPRYVAEGKKYLTIALGCTGGRHRSVLVAERLADHLLKQGWRVDLTHRELGAAPSEQRTTQAGALGGAQPVTGREALTKIP